MPWLIPSIIATLCGSIVLFTMYLYFYRKDRHRFLAIWTVSWGLYALRFIFSLTGLMSGPSPLLSWAEQTAALLSGVLLLAGTRLFLGKSFNKPLWAALSAVAGSWITASHILPVSFVAKTLPTFFFLGIVYVLTGKAFLRNKDMDGSAPAILGAIFIVWGLHKMDYPFLRPIESFAPWGFLLSAVLELAAALCMLLLYFERTRKELGASEQRYHQLFNTMLSGFALHEIILDAGGKPVDYRFLDVNPAFERIMSLSRKDVVGKRVLEIMPDLESFWIDTYGKVALMGHPAHFEHHSQRFGKILEVIAFRPAPGQFAVIFEDTTQTREMQKALLESEKRWQFALEGSGDGIWDWNIPAETMTFSRRGLDMFGYNDFPLTLHQDEWLKRLHADDLPVVRREMEKHLRGETSVYLCEQRIRCRDESYKWILARGKLLTRTPDGAPLRMVGTHSDLTERKRMEDGLRQSQKLEAIGTLAGGIAHDFNNILAAILGYTEMTLEDVPPGSNASFNLQQVHKAAHRARDLISQILLFSRKQHGERKVCRIEPVVEEALKLLRASLPSTIEIRRHFQLSSQGVVLADLTQIHQVILNLCTNAAYAMRRSGGVLTVEMEEADLACGSEEVLSHGLDPGPYIRLTITDTGEGIDPAIRNRIFEPFFTTKPFGEGTGMGLAVAYGILQAHGGTITLESSPGKGSSFHVLLPLAQTAAEPRVNEDETLPPPPSQRKHVLVVDDEVPLVTLGRMMLEQLGYEVTSRSTSPDALDAFKANPQGFDLLVTDQTMPHMTGVELAKEVLRLRTDMPIILCTGHSDTVTEAKALEMGIRAFMMKPVTRSKLARAVAKVLQEPVAESEEPNQEARHKEARSS